MTRHHHAAEGFPTKPTCLAVIKNGHYKTWPGLKEADPPASEGEWAVLLQTHNLQHEFDKHLYTDQTGRFPYTSFKGNCGSNAVLAEPIRNRTAGAMLEAHESIIQQLPEGEARPTVTFWTTNAPEILTKQSWTTK